MEKDVEQLVLDVMTNFIESGYPQWPLIQDYRRTHPDDDEVGYINEIIISSSDSELHPKWTVLTPEEVLRAMVKIGLGMTNVHDGLSELILEALTEKDYMNLDAETDDAIIQVAVFDELVYS